MPQLRSHPDPQPSVPLAPPANQGTDPPDDTLVITLPQGRSLTLDALKCLLAVAVLAIHSNPLALLSPSLDSVLVNGLCRIAVPTFFVINGFYIVRSLHDRPAFATWLARMARLYVFWMLVYAPFYLGSQDHSVARLLKTIVFGYLQLWYVAALLIGAPVLFLLHDRMSPRRLFATSVALFGLGVCMQYGSFLSGGAEHYTLYRNAVFFGFPFLSFGYLLRTGFFDGLSEQRRRRLLAIGLTLLAAEIVVVQSHMRAGATFDMYASLLLICPLLVDRVRQQRRIIWRDDVGVMSSVIYFAHPLGISLAQALLHRAVGGGVFLGSLAFCAAVAWPLRQLSRRWPFVL